MNREQHDNWLRRRGVHPDQLRTVLRGQRPAGQNAFLCHRPNRRMAEGSIPSNGTIPVDMGRAIFSKQNFTIGPAYNKGAIQLISRDDVPYMGKK